MKITIFGATGLTGKELVNQALERDLDVVCLVRRELDVRHPRLKVINGSITNLEQVRTAIEGSDAVISVLGSAPKVFGNKSTDVYSMRMLAESALRARFHRPPTLAGDRPPELPQHELHSV
jgi:putative NADH-flavin reductase